MVKDHRLSRRRLLKTGFWVSILGSSAQFQLAMSDDGKKEKLTSNGLPTPAGNYVDVGAGPPLVFSHGFMMDRTMFEPQIQAFKDDYRVVAFDSRARYRDHGEAYDLYNLVADCRLLLDQLNINSCVLVGMSMGGWMALRFALKYPNRLAGLVLIDSSAHADPEQQKEQFAEAFAPLQNCEKLPEDFVDWVTPLMFGKWTKEYNPRLVERWHQKFLGYSCQAVYNEANSWRDREDLSQRISEIQKPTLIVHGEEDIAEPLANVKPMVDVMPNAQLVSIPNAGHSSNIEQPQTVNQAIENFLKTEIYG